MQKIKRFYEKFKSKCIQFAKAPYFLYYIFMNGFLGLPLYHLFFSDVK